MEIRIIKFIRHIHAHISFVCSNNVCASMYFLVLDFSRSKKIKYSSPRLVVDRMEELIVDLLLVEKVWCQKQR